MRVSPGGGPLTRPVLLGRYILVIVESDPAGRCQEAGRCHEIIDLSPGRYEEQKVDDALGSHDRSRQELDWPNTANTNSWKNTCQSGQK
jgi:hypothetical protein